MPEQLPIRRLLVLLAVILLAANPVAAADGPTPVKLNPPLAANGDVSWFKLSPDGNRVAFLADAETWGQPSIFTVRPDGTDLVQLTAPTGAYWYDLTRFSPDGRRFLFQIKDSTAPNNRHLYSAPAEGPASAVTRLDPAAGDLAHFEITPDSQWVLYVADEGTEGDQLYLVPIGGPAGAARRISGPAAEDGYVARSLYITDDGTRVFWSAAKPLTHVFNLYTRLLHDPTAPIVRLSGDLDGNGVQSLAGGLAVSPDGSRVAYIGETATGRGELFIVPVDGPPSANVKLNPPIVSGGGIEMVKWHRETNLLVYSGRVEDNDTGALYTISPDGPPGAAVKLSAPGPDGRPYISYRLTAGGWVVYTGPDGLYSVPVAGTAADNRRIAPPSDQYTTLNNDLLVYTLPATAQVYRVPIVGPDSAAEPLGGRGSYCMSQGGRYTALRGTADEQLYRVLTTGGPLTPVSGPLTPGGAVLDCAVTPTGAYVVYRADQLVDGQNELFSTRLPVDSPGWDVRLPLLMR